MERSVEEKNLRTSISSIVDPEAPTTTNESGGSQSDIPVRFDLIDAKALFEMAKVLDHGAKKYGEDNWRLIPVKDHLNHLLMHTYAYLAGDITDEHLSHILCRATFALGVSLQEEEAPYEFYEPATNIPPHPPTLLQILAKLTKSHISAIASWHERRAGILVKFKNTTEDWFILWEDYEKAYRGEIARYEKAIS